MTKSIKRILAVLLVLTMILCFFGCKKEGGSEETTKASEEQVGNVNPLTGTDDLDASAKSQRPVAVVVENSPAARPQWGLGSADITVEGLAEGGITRTLWLYSDVNSIPKVGPIRSARIDFVEVAEGFNAIFTHIGWAATAEAAIKARGTDHVYLNIGTEAIRDTSRNVAIEHRATSDGEKISEAIASRKISTENKASYATPFSFFDKATDLTGGACKTLSMMFSSSYKHTFTYNADDAKYYVNMNSNKWTDENGNQMAITNVIILYYPSHSYISSSKNSASIDMDLSGGTGVVASNGTFQKINWKKGGPSDMIKITDESGNEFKLNQGKSYLALVPQSNAGSTTIA